MRCKKVLDLSLRELTYVIQLIVGVLSGKNALRVGAICARLPPNLRGDKNLVNRALWEMVKYGSVRLDYAVAGRGEQGSVTVATYQLNDVALCPNCWRPSGYCHCKKTSYNTASEPSRNPQN